MKIEFAHNCMIELRRSASSLVLISNSHPGLPTFEGNSFSFAAVVPLTEVRKPTVPGFTSGFASGPASVNGAIGPPRILKYCARLISAVIFVLCGSSAAMGNDSNEKAALPAANDPPLLIEHSAQASVSIIAMNEAQSRVHFSASGLPSGLSINPHTGVISGLLDREASRNDGAPLIVKVIVRNGAGASGSSTIKLQIENHAPIAVDDVLQLSSHSGQLNVLANDSDQDGDRLVVTDVIAQHGAVAFSANGLVAYVPNPGPRKVDTITYQASDGHGGVVSAKVVVISSKPP